MSWYPLSRRSPIGIDVTPRHLHAVQLSGRAGGRRRLEAALSLPRSEDDLELTEEEMQQLTDVLPRRGFQGRRVVVSMPGEHVITEVFRSADLQGRVPEVDELREMIAKAHRTEATSLECAGWKLPATRPNGPPSGVMAVACPHGLADHYLDVVEHDSLHVVGLDVRCQALQRACAIRIEGADSLAALVDLGWNCARLVVLCGSVVIFERTLGDCGLNRLQMTLTGRLGLDPDVAEYVLTRIGFGRGDGDTAISSSLLDEFHGHLESYLKRLNAELKRSFSYAVQEYPDRSFSMIGLVGDGAVMPGLAEPIGEELGVKALVTAPNDILDCPESLQASARSPLLTVAVGLAMYDGG